MDELKGNEKFADLLYVLLSSPVQTGTIQFSDHGFDNDDAYSIKLPCKGNSRPIYCDQLLL
jgi:hypothetical protein